MKITSVLTIALPLLASSLVAAKNCGSGIGSCPEGQCCSQYGFCGTTSEYCENTLGCQKDYGSCYASTSNGKCGKNYGRCPKPYHCCSESGYCGEGDDYCGSGCQSAYGLCGDEEMVMEEDVEWVTEIVTQYVYVYVEEQTDSRECGADVAKTCPSGKCCSKYGYCGISEAFCSVKQGCQAKYGDCYEVVDTAAEVASVDDSVECGPGIGSCINGECCNSEGHCGISKEFCDVDNGCQEDYGVCNSQSQVGECGEGFGRCPNSEHCCSRVGFCGTSDAYCAMSQGCQPEYGLCIEDRIEEDVYETDVAEETTDITSAHAIEPECGEGIGSCPEGQCCSAEGICGSTYAFCNLEDGCQKEFGICNSDSPIGKCGEGFGRCPVDEQCCSAEGFCGTTEHYCLPSNGCQELYGRCDATVSNDFII